MYELQSFGLAVFAAGFALAVVTNLRPVALVLGFIPHARRGLFRFGVIGSLGGLALFIFPLLIGIAVNSVVGAFS